MFEGIAVPKYETLVFFLEMSLDSNIELHTLLFRLLGGHNLHLRQEERGEAVPSKAPRPGKKEADNQTEQFLESILPP